MICTMGISSPSCGYRYERYCDRQTVNGKTIMSFIIDVPLGLNIVSGEKKVT